MKTLGLRVREAEKQSERAHVTTYFCTLEGSECSLLKMGKCIHLGFLSNCVYGRASFGKTSTKKAKAYRQALSKFREEEAKYKLPAIAYGVGMYLIGDYYYLPYAHMDMCEAVPFVRHSRLFIAGIPFVPKHELTPERIVFLAKFKPQALMGGEITTYQREEVPKFLFHLQQRFPELYQAAIILDVSIAQKTTNLDNVKELKATLCDIPVGITSGYKMLRGNHCIDVVAWDGTELTITGKLGTLGLPFCHGGGSLSQVL